MTVVGRCEVGKGDSEEDLVAVTGTQPQPNATATFSATTATLVAGVIAGRDALEFEELAQTARPAPARARATRDAIQARALLDRV
jgi:hypothetical protein